MTFRHIAVVVLSLVGSAVSRDCWGGLILQFSPNNTVTSINVNLNDTFNVDLYVAQDGGETRLTSAGLLSFGVRATYDTGLLNATGGNVSADFPINGNPDIDVSVPGQADFFGGSLAPPQSSSIYLGTVQFTALAPGVTTILFGDLDPSFDDFSLNDAPAFTGIDQDLFGPTFTGVYGISVNVATVPEPSSVGLLMLSFLLTSRLRFSRRLQWLSAKRYLEPCP